MSSDQTITRELSLSEIVSKTFELYRRNFVKYFTLFVVVEAIIGVVDTIAYHAFVLPTLPVSPTSQQVVNWLPGFFGALIELIAVVGIAALVFGTIAYASTIKMASEELENKSVDLGAAVRFAASKLLWIWALGIILWIIVGLGFVALVVPGVILLIMFFLSFQALLIENTGVIASLGRSRELVGHRWLKTLGVILVFGVILVVAGAIVSAISGPFGYWNQLVSSIISALYQPLLPVATTVYFYSNRTRINPAQTGQTTSPAAMPAPGMKFCPNCGAQLEATATFCPKCGAKQPA